MTQFTASASPLVGDEPRFEVVKDENIKLEPRTGSPQLPIPGKRSSKSPSEPILPTTEPPDPSPMARSVGKKGTAAVKKATKKRSKMSDVKKAPKKAAEDKRSTSAGANEDEEMEDLEEEDESDNGPYCLCRGPDDHRWMICCEKCEDWFHGECINMDKEIGENLIEKFICPNCKDERRNLVTIYKKKCELKSCKKPARLTAQPPSKFCSNEHVQIWWERVVNRMPKEAKKTGGSDQLTQEELMALLSSDLGTIDEGGNWKLARTPFAGSSTGKGPDGTDDSTLFSEEEKHYLSESARTRARLAEETALCHQMITIVDLVQQRRRAAISAGRFANDSCGYDYRLDTVGARDQFAAFAASSEGKAILQDSKVNDPRGEGDETRGMCEKKRCKTHKDWQKILPLGVKHSIREMAGATEEMVEDEKRVKEAARERSRRRQAEQNSVDIVLV